MKYYTENEVKYLLYSFLVKEERKRIKHTKPKRGWKKKIWVDNPPNEGTETMIPMPPEEGQR